PADRDIDPGGGDGAVLTDRPVRVGHRRAEADLAGRAFPDDVMVAGTRGGEVGDLEPVDPPVGPVGDHRLLELAVQHGPVPAGEDLAGSTVAAAEDFGGDVLAVAGGNGPAEAGGRQGLNLRGGGVDGLPDRWLG